MYIGILAAIVIIVYVCSPDLFEAYWNYANGGYSAAPPLGIFCGFAVLGLPWLACWYFPAQGVVRKMGGAGVNKYLRGSLVIDGSANQAQEAKARADFERNKKQSQYNGYILLGRLCMPASDEKLHTLIIGATGSGKSVAIRGSIVTIAERAKHTGERMIIADPDGGYAANFFNEKRGDRILSPFDPRSAKWAMFKEISRPYDADNIAAALVPDPGGDAGEWARKARIVVSSAVEALARTPGAESCDLYEVCCLATVPELRDLLARTPAARFFEEGNERTMLSILTTVTGALSALRYLNRGDNFSITDWVKGKEGKGWLFLPYAGEQIAALKPLFRTWVRTAIFSALSLPEGDNKLWFLIDEFDALGKLEGLADALPRLRKFGGRVILGTQTIGMLEQLYGSGYADTIAENASNTLILRCRSGKSNGDGTSKFASHLIGQREVQRIVHSTNTSSGSGRSTSGTSSNQGTTFSTAEQIVLEDAVLPSQIEQLRVGTGYMKFASQREWQFITIPNDDKAVAVLPANTPKTPKEAA
ncbi:MAG: type IV secretion system DNA-binding domain-containing protein [Terracidiphilus sp.]